jgi:hypothetical protein
MPMRRIFDLNTAIHPGGRPSGIVPGVLVSGRCLRSWRSCGEKKDRIAVKPLPLGSFL